MFAYCLNNPVNGYDPSGSFPLWIIPLFIVPLLLSGCNSSSDSSPKSELANAPDLDINTAPNDSFNCYGNGIGKQIVADPTGYKPGQSAETVFSAVQADLGGEKNCKRLASFATPVDEGWFRVALMCGRDDYHFIRETEDGWYNKSGYDSRVGGCYLSADLVNANVWYAYGTINNEVYKFISAFDPVYYSNNGPIYFEIRKGWDKG